MTKLARSFVMASADQLIILAPNFGVELPLPETEKRPNLLLLSGHFLPSFMAEQGL